MPQSHPLSWYSTGVSGIIVSKEEENKKIQLLILSKGKGDKKLLLGDTNGKLFSFKIALF